MDNILNCLYFFINTDTKQTLDDVAFWIFLFWSLLFRVFEQIQLFGEKCKDDI